MKNNIEVSVRHEFLPQHSNAGEYVFAYHISIRNRGTQSAQLMSRKWLITDGDGKESEVRGDGVVGEQPIISPEESFDYSSFSVLKTQVGCMQGVYFMQAEDGTLFEAEIPTFTLAVAGALH